MIEDDEAPEIVLLPTNVGVEWDDPRFTAALDELQEGVRAEGDRVEIRSDDDPGYRGGAAELIMVLGTSGAIGAALTAFKSWLDRDKARILKLRIRRKASKARPAVDLEIQVDSADLAGTSRLIKQALE